MEVITIGKKTTCELCGAKIRGSREGYPGPIPESPIAFCIPCRIAYHKKQNSQVKIFKNNA